MSEENLELTPEEQALLTAEFGRNYPKEEEKQNIYNYFKKVISMKDNTKTANLTEDEIGFAKIPVRTNQEIALFCDVMGMGDIEDGGKMKGFAGYFMKEAQILLGTSLSREGFLNKLAVTQKRESSFNTKAPAQNKGWFKKKKKKPVGMEEF